MDFFDILARCRSIFPHHHPDPVKTANLADLRKAVVEFRADLGVAYDGDADRLGVVDETGGIIWGDMLMCLYWREILLRYLGRASHRGSEML